jgi:hypothetical protein
MSESLERIWAQHLNAEFATRDVEATLATMVDDDIVLFSKEDAAVRSRSQHPL